MRSLRTVAGNLEQVEVNRMHKVTPMPESLSAIDVAGQLAAIPQRHISGADDRVVAAVIAKRFVRAGAKHPRSVLPWPAWAVTVTGPGSGLPYSPCR